MRAVLTNLGSTGDVQPFLTLAVELRLHGHRPVLALLPEWRAPVEKLGLDFVPLTPRGQRQTRDVFGAMLTAPDSQEEFRRFLDSVTLRLSDMFVCLRSVCRDADVIIGGPHQPAARMVHEAAGIPFVSLRYGHFDVPSAYRPPAGSRLRSAALPLPIARIVNRMLWRRMRRGIRRMSRRAINPHRTAVGLPPLDEPWFLDTHSEQLALFAVSRHIACPPPDWPPRYHLTGFFFPDDSAWPVDPEIADFMSAGERPVVFAFGSMMHEDPDGLTSVLIDAVSRIGCRAVIERGWSRLGNGTLPLNIRAGSAPYAWLFPRAACVVHHGGIGTTAQALRAGVPSVFVPHLADQYDWAALVRELGCAGPALPYPELTAGALASAVMATLQDTCVRQATERLGAQVRAEPGTPRARELIEALLA